MEISGINKYRKKNSKKQHFISKQDFRGTKSCGSNLLRDIGIYRMSENINRVKNIR